ncbi:glycosyltransferase family 2 protein [Okeania sp. SIO1I7]|uniref:glycosyltransferase n=1 Tax=Okeania sp. SIO1I7 TaxID=2607772 RepID=UPI0013FA75ED|nr:glycosyltransferase family 2 protein [Okeania sp. SIO1I7]NET27445.1 glycosyltransferase family 2 protein [Okeania sp. SIO1I7]
MPRIAATICTYNRYDYLAKAIESVRNQTLTQEQYKILIIDNSPDYEYAQKVQQEYHQPPFLIYHIEKIPGLSNARNVAAKLCETEFIAYLDDDAIASPQWLEKIVAGFDSFGTNAAALGGRVDPIWEIERPTWLHDELLSYVSVVNWGGEIRVAKPDEWFAGANIAFRTQDILENGGFDVSLGRTGSGTSLMSNEEIHLLNQIKSKGKLTIYAPEAKVDHLVEKKRLNHAWFRKRVVWQAVSDYQMNPEKAIEEAQSGWSFLLEYFFGLPPKERTIRGLFYDTDDPKQFREQLWVLSTFTAMLLSGFDGVEK